MSDRYHALDSFRGFAMLLGVFLHAGVSFMMSPPVFWSVRDSDPTPVVDVFLFGVHNFRMQAFFVLAGFFGCLLYQRYGLVNTLRHRVKRVVIPFVLSLIFVVPTIMIAFLSVELQNVREFGVPENASAGRKLAAELIAAYPDSSDAIRIANRLSAPDKAALPPLAHLWFLYYLIYFYLAVAILTPACRWLAGSRVLQLIDRGFSSLIKSRWRCLICVFLTLPVFLTMSDWFVETPQTWNPEWPIIGYYSVFFVFGWLLYRHRELVPAFGRGWKLNLLLANLVVLPLALSITFAGLDAAKSGTPASNIFAWRVAAFTAQALYTWLMIAGLWGAFLHYFARERMWTRYLADASYWCYLASITPIIFLQYWVKDWPVPGVVKWLFVSVLAMTFLLLTYEWCVRYTFIGAILNGRKTRVRRKSQFPETPAPPPK
jgi:peptidoglycan/LPS O-acetylase OafA/YrhL